MRNYLDEFLRSLGGRPFLFSSFQLTDTPEEYRYLEGHRFGSYNEVVESIREHQELTSGSLLLIESGIGENELALGHAYAYTPIGRISRAWRH